MGSQRTIFWQNETSIFETTLISFSFIFYLGTNILQYPFRRLSTGIVADPHNSMGLPTERHCRGYRQWRGSCNATCIRYWPHRDLRYSVCFHRRTDDSHATRETFFILTGRGKFLLSKFFFENINELLLLNIEENIDNVNGLNYWS